MRFPRCSRVLALDAAAVHRLGDGCHTLPFAFSTGALVESDRVDVWFKDSGLAGVIQYLSGKKHVILIKTQGAGKVDLNTQLDMSNEFVLVLEYIWAQNTPGIVVFIYLIIIETLNQGLTLVAYP